MTLRFIVSGTDTGVGKTVFAAALAGALDGYYWKPVQAGLDAESDSSVVRRLSGLLPERILPEAWRLARPASPHLAAELEGVRLDPARLVPPPVDGPLVIEGAGGLLVPLCRPGAGAGEGVLQIDVFARWAAPVILCARVRLGAINHSLLSLEALRRRNIPVLGVVFTGEENPDTEAIVCAMGGVRRLGRLPHLAPLDACPLRTAFAANFRLEDFCP